MQPPGYHYRRASQLITEAESDYLHPLHSKKVALASAHAALAALPDELYLHEKYPPLEPVTTPKEN